MLTADFTSETPIGVIATHAPLATRVFARHGLDYCCGGGLPLGEACARHSLDVERVLAEVRQEVASTSGQGQAAWAEAPLSDLIAHILAVYHRPLDEELPRLEFMARKVHSVHRDKDPERLGELVEVFATLVSELVPHMEKEEEILFPLILAGRGAETDGPVEFMRAEHELVGELLVRLRALTDDYTVPEEACNTWRALWHGLADLERSLHEHIHLENNILFPRALAS